MLSLQWPRLNLNWCLIEAKQLIQPDVRVLPEQQPHPNSALWCGTSLRSAPHAEFQLSSVP
jgi:hypothetical protein